MDFKIGKQTYNTENEYEKLLQLKIALQNQKILVDKLLYREYNEVQD